MQRNFTCLAKWQKDTWKNTKKLKGVVDETCLGTFLLTLCFSLCFSPAEPYVWHPGAHTKWSHPWLAVQHGGQNPIQLRVRFCIGRTRYPHMYCVTWQRSTVGLPITVLQRCDFLSFFLSFSLCFFLSVRPPFCLYFSQSSNSQGHGNWRTLTRGHGPLEDEKHWCVYRARRKLETLSKAVPMLHYAADQRLCVMWFITVQLIHIVLFFHK